MNRYQTNTTPERSGQVWLKNWESLGPIDPFTPRTADGQVTPGPQDPQLAYGMSIAAAMDAQATKFCVSENPRA